MKTLLFFRKSVPMDILTIRDVLGQGVKILACENTMTNTKVTRADMLPNIGYVKAGVVELMVKQQGWAYIRP